MTSNGVALRGHCIGVIQGSGMRELKISNGAVDESKAGGPSREESESLGVTLGCHGCRSKEMNDADVGVFSNKMETSQLA